LGHDRGADRDAGEGDEGDHTAGVRLDRAPSRRGDRLSLFDGEKGAKSRRLVVSDTV
jgi:hypothetical protein